MSINTTLNYSPNFDKKKRKFKQIKFIIFHYTGMKNEKVAIKRLTDSKSKVSSNFLIRGNGKIITLVPELYVSWHAGISSWQNYKSLNKIRKDFKELGISNYYKEKSRTNKRFYRKTTSLFKELVAKHDFIPVEIEISTFTSWK